eukprot:jgi/Ulvmu1/5834/UM025_0092.1
MPGKTSASNRSICRTPLCEATKATAMDQYDIFKGWASGVPVVCDGASMASRALLGAACEAFKLTVYRFNMPSLPRSAATSCRVCWRAAAPRNFSSSVVARAESQLNWDNFSESPPAASNATPQPRVRRGLDGSDEWYAPDLGSFGDDARRANKPAPGGRSRRPSRSDDPGSSERRANTSWDSNSRSKSDAFDNFSDGNDTFGGSGAGRAARGRSSGWGRGAGGRGGRGRHNDGPPRRYSDPVDEVLGERFSGGRQGRGGRSQRGSGGYSRGRGATRHAWDSRGGGQGRRSAPRDTWGDDGRRGSGESQRELWDSQLRSQGEVAEARDGMQGTVALYGVAPVLTALQAQRRAIHALYLQETMNLARRKDATAITRIRAAADDAGVAVMHLSKHAMNALADNRPHQGVILDCGELEVAELDVLPSAAEIAAAAPGAAPPVWLVLDEVADPQNFGAVARSVMFLGAAGMLVSTRNCAPLSASASKASAGALEALPVHGADNLPRTLLAAADSGWTVLGADGAASAAAADAADVTVAAPTLLVLGSEGAGLRTNVRRACRGFVKVRDAPRLDRAVLDSLNVSVATGVLLHSLLRAADATGGDWTPTAKES